VFIDNQFQGAYELPARFPVLKTGNQKILITPGIEVNGIAATRAPYPFYKGYDSTQYIPENATLTINPTAEYFQAAQCAFCESFDGSGFALAPTGSSDTIMYQLPVGDANIFEPQTGASSGVVYLDSANTQFEFASTSFYELPGSGAAVFLEMNYKCNQEMQIGLFVDVPGTGLSQVPIFNINPSNTWNKIYVQLGYAVSTYSYANKFKLYIKGVKSNNVNTATFYFDNIKVVHF
jgi:hypothetical protein